MESCAEAVTVQVVFAYRMVLCSRYASVRASNRNPVSTRIDSTFRQGPQPLDASQLFGIVARLYAVNFALFIRAVDLPFDVQRRSSSDIPEVRPSIRVPPTDGDYSWL